MLIRNDFLFLPYSGKPRPFRQVSVIPHTQGDLHFPLQCVDAQKLASHCSRGNKIIWCGNEMETQKPTQSPRRFCTSQFNSSSITQSRHYAQSCGRHLSPHNFTHLVKTGYRLQTRSPRLLRHHQKPGLLHMLARLAHPKPPLGKSPKCQINNQHAKPKDSNHIRVHWIEEKFMLISRLKHDSIAYSTIIKHSRDEMRLTEAKGHTSRCQTVVTIDLHYMTDRQQRDDATNHQGDDCLAGRINESQPRISAAIQRSHGEDTRDAVECAPRPIATSLAELHRLFPIQTSLSWNVSATRSRKHFPSHIT
ncbi:hypothetical protein F2P79_011722 [Pimephales promelas]|nr:hypothetical protein F2P79_011722 [Pimephales promelas]